MLTMIYRFGARSQPSKLESSLYPPFATILQNDVQGMASWDLTWIPQVTETQNLSPTSFNSLQPYSKPARPDLFQNIINPSSHHY